MDKKNNKTIGVLLSKISTEQFAVIESNLPLEVKDIEILR